MGTAGSQGKVGDALDSQLVPDGTEIVTFVELDFVGDLTGTELLVGCVLKVPASLRLLDVLAQGQLVGSGNAIFDSTPDLQVLGRISVLVLGRSLPGDEEGAERGEAELEDIEDGEGKNLLAGGSVDNGNNFGARPGKVTATGRVCTTPEVPFRIGEPRERLVRRRSIEQADALLGAVGKLQL